MFLRFSRGGREAGFTYQKFRKYLEKGGGGSFLFLRKEPSMDPSKDTSSGLNPLAPRLPQKALLQRLSQVIEGELQTQKNQNLQVPP